MKKHIVIPLLVILGCLIIFFITQWQYPGGPTGTTGTAEEGSVEGAGLADSGDSTTLSADERTNARNGRLDSKESAGDRDLQPVAVTTEIIAATEASQPADETIEYPTKEGFWITGFSKTEDGKFIPGAVITAEKKGEEKTKYGTRTITSATFEALTDTHGHYEVQTDGPGKYELRSRAPKYIGEFIDGFGKCELSETEKIATVDLIHRTGSGYWIVGTVKSESGEPIPGSKISAYYIVFDRGPIYRTQSDSKGNYVLKVGGPGVHAVYSEPTGEYIPEREVARLCTAEQPEKQTMVNFVHRAGGCLVHGRVIDGETSEPIPDAIVRLSSHNPLGLAGYFEVFTDENGKFQIRISEDLYAVSAEAKGYLHYRGIEDSGGGLDSLEINKETAQNEIVIKMRRGLAVKIIATDPSGKPVERATVLVYSSHSDGNGRTDSNGECVIDTLSEGSAVAIVEKNWGKEERSSGGLYKETRGQSAGDEVVSKAYSEPFVPGPRENPPVVRVTLLECASVSGHVTYKESGKPVANRQMSIEFLNFAAVFGRPLTSEGSTDGDGIYGFSRLAPGKYVISVNRNSSYEQLASQDITLQAAEHREGLDFAIEDEEANEVVEGKIVNEQGEAIPFAYVGLSTKDPKKPDASIWKHANANDQGEFKFTELPKADSFRISVRASGYSEVNQEQFPMNGELLTITLKPSASIAGVVLSKEKRIPVPNAKVSIQVFYGGTVTADSMGQFEIKDVEPGAYEVTAEAEGYATGKSAPIAIKGEESVRDVVIELEFGKEFAGILIDPMQNPLGGGTVGLASRVRNTNRELSSNSFQLIAIPDNVKSADDGSFRVGGVPSQGDTLLISHPQFAPRKFAVSSEMLGREPIPIQLTPGGAIEGNVVDQQQKPVQGARIDVFNYPENLYCYNVITDENGGYRVEHLSALRFRVECRRGGTENSDEKIAWVQEGKTVRVDFGTGEGATIRGTVYKDGIPVPNALINLEQLFGQDKGLVATSLQDGTYEFKGVSPGDCRIRFTTQEGAGSIGWSKCEGIERLTVVPEQKEYLVDLHVRSFRVIGTIRDAETKEPIPGVDVQTRPTMDVSPDMVRYMELALQGVTTDNQGIVRFRLPGLGTYPLVTMKRGYVDSEFSVTADPTQGSSEIPVELFLTKSDTSVLVYLTFQGRPVTLTDRRFFVIRDGSLHRTASTPLEDPPGAYRLPGMRPGPMELIVESEDSTRTLFAYPQPITLERGQEGRMFIDLFSAVIYELQLRTSDNSPVPMDFRVEAPEVPGLARLEGCRFFKGLPYYVPLPVGRYRVRITAPGYQPLEFIPADIAEPTYTSGRAVVSVQLVK